MDKQNWATPFAHFYLMHFWQNAHKTGSRGGKNSNIAHVLRFIRCVCTSGGSDKLSRLYTKMTGVIVVERTHRKVTVLKLNHDIWTESLLSLKHFTTYSSVFNSLMKPLRSVTHQNKNFYQQLERSIVFLLPSLLVEAQSQEIVRQSARLALQSLSFLGS